MLFLTKKEVLAIHHRAIDEFGGARGILDEGALEAALVAAENRAWYEDSDVATCAATYAFHLCQGHPFLDGNKRVAAAVSEVFLIINDCRLAADDDEIYDLFMALAAGKRTRDQVEVWFRKRTDNVAGS